MPKDEIALLTELDEPNRTHLASSKLLGVPLLPCMAWMDGEGDREAVHVMEFADISTLHCARVHNKT